MSTATNDGFNNQKRLKGNDGCFEFKSSFILIYSKSFYDNCMREPNVEYSYNSFRKRPGASCVMKDWSV